MAARSWPDWSSRRLPLPVIAVPATAAPSPTASRTAKPRATPAARPPQNASPAPVLSATWTSIAGTCVLRPSARRHPPADPAFTTATAAPARARATPLLSAFFLVAHRFGAVGPGRPTRPPKPHTRLSQRGKRAARKVISPPGDERRLGTCRDDGRRGVHAVAAQPRHPGDAGGENDIVDGEVSDDEHKLAVTRRNQRCQERFAHSGGISR